MKMSSFNAINTPLATFWSSCYFLELLLGSSIWWRELGETPSDPRSDPSFNLLRFSSFLQRSVDVCYCRSSSCLSALVCQCLSTIMMMRCNNPYDSVCVHHSSVLKTNLTKSFDVCDSFVRTGFSAFGFVVQRINLAPPCLNSSPRAAR